MMLLEIIVASLAALGLFVVVAGLAIYFNQSVRDGFASSYGYVPRTPKPLPRIHNGADAVARGMRYSAFYEEEDGLRDMITSLRQDYFQKMGELKPNDLDGLRALGMADRIAREIERKVQSVIETGRIRGNERHVRNIASIR